MRPSRSSWIRGNANGLFWCHVLPKLLDRRRSRCLFIDCRQLFDLSHAIGTLRCYLVGLIARVYAGLLLEEIIVGVRKEVSKESAVGFL